jgi:hypothetical protein
MGEGDVVLGGLAALFLREGGAAQRVAAVLHNASFSDDVVVIGLLIRQSLSVP